MDTTELQNAVHDLRTATPGYSNNRRGVAFYSILKATEKVPYDSAILLLTGRAAEDEDLAAITTENLTSKRCKVSSGSQTSYQTAGCISDNWASPCCSACNSDGARLGHDPM
jgi:hypothetical protein